MIKKINVEIKDTFWQSSSISAPYSPYSQIYTQSREPQPVKRLSLQNYQLVLFIIDKSYQLKKGVGGCQIRKCVIIMAESYNLNNLYWLYSLSLLNIDKHKKYKCKGLTKFLS